ncbi:MAG: sigma 54-interacting transcriptional regulator [Eubacteriales bacterium]|nr:sigma 54-interacting transcriptional regulator [Eubacteriales bacterium]
MSSTQKKNVNLLEYEDVVIVNKEGCIVYDDQSSWSLYDLNPSQTIGHNVLSLYENLTKENSIFYQVLRTGIPVFDAEQELITKEKNRIYQISSTFPILSFGEIIGAIEFSKFLYKTDSLHNPKNHPLHKSLKKNNTIYTIEDIVTKDQKMLLIKEQITKVAKTDSSVLIYGKTGTGKELIAQAIHNLSDRCSKPFISINCAAIPGTLLESILFGTVKGSYTDAADRAGLFEQAEGGTLFLDETNSMDVTMQVKLLKAIEDRYIRRIGDTKNIVTDIRILSAVNENPDRLIEAHKLREDLYYRLGTVIIELPSLKERKQDVRVLMNHYIKFYNSKMKIKIKEVDPSVYEMLENYSWPGNVRELRNVIENLYNTVSENGVITQDHISGKIKGDTLQHTPAPLYESMGLKQAVDEFEKNLILKAMQANRGIAAYAAKTLKVSKQTLQYKLEKYQLID